ncbi:MAG: hypothetical protein UX87_C0041G0004 [Candidatus Amesbacteria bacterium GW2011_GWA1_47_16]|uniref:L,D-TPase catalytic domain-containing protein n=5 Tax=Candidatus Amesiibacteriota TaxID=1752730 RepID=A0A1F4ZYZ4_9BACT|nr:MAG: hypothetical protein UX87_C0041G0004 [Candidatus Amesbacteria bacterium GW2011_GWA1_47_16]KKU63529.1 MAG: hypothetical protein UX86_C0022G0003 [Candidatus Amesbacteria bacterium GW2011_GWC1_47_15]KKU97726.1 MAG: hypothetical protein UY28_C0015G0006 [Candidatus Amesbacteria bacterium GW2011_GWB1_48_13]OGC98062.1 MAG: hypothetical protein A2701_00325 [Candidatus Amesbacteria bacterium RIFCSPHIGHO2_01_FULL_47_34]OGC99595.1 MAG: hypothetical protein A2972_02445 [Candidatus Amesbacteria bact
MRPAHSLILLLVIGVVIVGGLQLGIKKLTSPASTVGCLALTDDGQTDPTETVAIWQGRAIAPPQAQNESLLAAAPVLGESSEEKWIEIDLSEQRLTAHQGGSVFLTSLISSGLWNKTPAGEYRMWYKIRSTKMSGGSKLNKTYYYLPNVPYAMFFYGDYGIHGTYWHNNFGNPMSHGCVNAPTSVAEKLFYWVGPVLPEGKKSVRSSAENPGTRVVVHQ